MLKGPNFPFRAEVQFAAHIWIKIKQEPFLLEECVALSGYHAKKWTCNFEDQ